MNLEESMLALKFVRWDRMTVDGDTTHVYGWIDRKKDAYKDFVLVVFFEGLVDSFTTSSALYSKRIHKLLGFEEEGEKHTPCVRVEKLFKNVPNVVHL